MGFLDDEASVEHSQPREGIEITIAGQVHRLATGTRDIVIDGAKFTATPAHRPELIVPDLGSDATPQLTIYPQHPAVVRYMLGAVPPRNIPVNVYRIQTSGDVEVIWRGRITSLTWRDGLAVFTVPSRHLLLVDRRLPSFSVGKHCPHVLYAANCRAPRASFKVTTTIALVSGHSITVASMGAHPDNYAQFGELVHVATGEPMTIAEQVGTTLTVPAPLGGMQTGDAVEVYAGCARSIDVCNDKFNNRVHFGNDPHLNADNIVVPPGFGVYTSA
jgi:hypothetical protein